MANLSAAYAARAHKSLNRQWRDPRTGEVYTLAQRLESGFYAYRYRDERDNSYGLISRADADAALAENRDYYRDYGVAGESAALSLMFAAYTECAKLVFDAADNLPTLTIDSGSAVLERVITDAEWAHLTGEDAAS